MSVIVCNEMAVMGFLSCFNCDGPVKAKTMIEANGGKRYCCEDCAAEHCEWMAENARREHLRMRDLLCACETCTAAGRPTVEERAEWQAYLDEQATR